MEDELIELGQEMLNFLNETGQYFSFLDWAEHRGAPRQEVEEQLDELQNFNS